MRTPSSTSYAPIKLIATLAGLTLLHGCALEDEPDDLEDESAVAAALNQSGNTVTAWATIAADAIVRPVEAEATLRAPGHSSMVMAQVQLAVYDVMAALDGGWQPFSYKEGCTPSRINRDAAVATAAYRVLRTRVPGRAGYLDAQYATALSAIENGRNKNNGIQLGEDVAAHYIALRANDNTDNTYTWVQPTPGPGVFEPVAPAQPVDYKMVFTPPFTFSIAQSASFFPPPPPTLTSQKYTTTFNETKSLGRVDSTTRTEAQRQLALWSGENAFRWAARNQIALAVSKRLNAMDAARYFAIAFTSGADAFQTGMSAKYHYNYWRPFHSVPRADTDNNPATTADPTWAPLLNVNHPEYPAGHGFFGSGTVVEAARAFFGTDRVSWTLDTVGVTGLTQTHRAYTSLNQLSQDVRNARVLAGLHYRFSMDEGRDQGARVVNHITSRHFKRRR